MKQFSAIFFFTIFYCAAIAQNNTDSAYHYVFVPTTKTKAIIHLKNNSAISGEIVKITDSILSVSITGENNTDSNIAIADIQNIKIKRNAFWLGMGSGAVLGGLVGYGVSYIAYSNDPTITDSENKDKQRSSSFVGALITAVPGAVIGSIVGSISIKRNFVINGDITNLKKMETTLAQFQ